jgi:glycosyltransferase involved in cell wall biosynthesis
MVARLVHKKDPMLLLKAFERVRGDHPCVLMFVGSGELEQQLRSYVSECQIPDVEFKGFMSRQEIGDAYAAADIFALTSSYRETWGAVVNEAMGFGLPILVTDQVGCAPDLVANNTNGYVVPSGDVDALAERLNQLIVDRALRERLGRQSAKKIELWNHSVAARGVLQAIADAVGPERWARSRAVVADSLKSDAP